MVFGLNFSKGKNYDLSRQEKTFGLTGPEAFKDRYGVQLDEKGEVIDTGQLGQEVQVGDIREQFRPGLSSATDALENLRKPSLFSETYQSQYTPQNYDNYTFNFEGLPKQFGDIQYQRGAENITGTMQDSMRQTRDALGTRRPDLLFKAEEAGQRELGRSLGGLQRDIATNVMGLETDLAARQQEQQAAENLRGAGFRDEMNRVLAGERQQEYASRADLERLKADDALIRAQALSKSGLDLAGTEGALLAQERGVTDDALKYYTDLALREGDSRRGNNKTGSFGLQLPTPSKIGGIPFD